MKKQLFLLIGLFLLNLAVTGQNSNLVVFSDEEPFTLLINGMTQNTNPQTNVKATGIGPNLRVRVKFVNAALPALDKVFAVEENTETTLRVKRDKKGEWKLAFFGSVPVGQSNPNVASTQSSYNTASSGSAADESNNASPANTFQNNAQINSGNTTITSSTVTTTTSKGSPDMQNGSVNINVNGMGVNMNVSGMGMDPNSGATMNTTTSTTITSTQSSGGSFSSSNSGVQQNNIQQNSTTPVKAGCTVAMNPGSFEKLRQNVESKPFSDTKMSTAKIATKNGCLSVPQVKEICKLFSMDDDKLIYAKYAYDYCVDKANYYQVSEVFSFSATTEDFNKFLEQK